MSEALAAITSAVPATGTDSPRLSTEQHAALEPSARLEYSRQFDQGILPDWQDPRTGQRVVVDATKRTDATGTTAKSSDPTATGDRAVIDSTKMAPADRVTVAAGDGTTFELSGDDFAAFMQHRAAEQARKQSVPADAAAYQAKLPDTLKLPQGVEFRVDEASPALRDFRAWAHQRGFTQDDFSTALGFMAAHSGAQEAQMREVMNAERAKLGPNIASRVDAVSNFMRGHLGDAGARAIQSMMVSAAIVENLETLVTKFATQGHASFSQAHRDPGGGSGLVSEEQFNSMSHAERIDYTRSAAARNAMAGRR